MRESLLTFTLRQSKRRSSLASCLVFLLLVVAPVFAGPAEREQDRGAWHTAAPAAMKRTEVAAATVGGKIYLVGGFEEPSISNVVNLSITPVVEEYDASTDKWSSKASMPVGLHHVGVGVVGGRLYVIGGYKQSGLSVWAPVGTLYAYDPAVNAWTELAAMPTARGALSVSVHEGNLYAIGGFDGKGNSAAVEVYDPAKNVWSTRASLPTPRDHLATATAAGKVYAIGGRVKGDYHRNLSVTEVYDPGSDKWTKAPDLPTARSGITAAEIGGRVYVFGGEGANGTFHENEAYDPAREAWQVMAPMPTARHGLGSGVIDGHIHLISGGPTPGGSFSNLNEVFSPPRSR